MLGGCDKATASMRRTSAAVGQHRINRTANVAVRIVGERLLILAGGWRATDASLIAIVAPPSLGGIIAGISPPPGCSDGGEGVFTA